MISIHPDAHSIWEIENIRLGVESARKGGLKKDMTLNAMSLPDIEKWLTKIVNGLERMAYLFYMHQCSN